MSEQNLDKIIEYVQKNFKNKPGNEITTRVEYEVFFGPELIDISLLKSDLEYQRDLDEPKVRELMESMKRYGFLPNESVVFNDNYELIDGKRRREAASRLGITKIPAVGYKFPDFKTETKFFMDMNSFIGPLAPKDWWKASKMYGEFLGTTLYKLNDDPTSLLYRRINLNGSNQNKQNFQISDALTIIGSSSLRYYHNWTRDRHELFEFKAKQYTYEEIKDGVNDFLDFFYTWNGNSKQDNPVPYKNRVLRSILIVYALLKNNGYLPPGKTIRTETLAKMRQFNFTNDFKKLDHSTAISVLLSQFNRGKKEENRVVYDPTRSIVLQ